MCDLRLLVRRLKFRLSFECLSDRFNCLNLLDVPSLFFGQVSQIGTGFLAEDWRSVIPSVCFRILPCFQVGYCCFRQRHARGYYVYPKAKPKCKCTRDDRGYGQDVPSPIIIGVKMHVLIEQKRYKLCMEWSGKIKVKSSDLKPATPQHSPRQETVYKECAEATSFWRTFIDEESFRIRGMQVTKS